jgi:hypothetical protein
VCYRRECFFLILLGLCARETRRAVDVANFLCSLGFSKAKGGSQSSQLFCASEWPLRQHASRPGQHGVPRDIYRSLHRTYSATCSLLCLASSVLMSNISFQPRHLLWVGRRGEDYETKRRETFRILGAFLSALGKLWKATVGFLMPALLLWNITTATGRIFVKFYNGRRGSFIKPVEKILVWLTL